MKYRVYMFVGDLKSKELRDLLFKRVIESCSGTNLGSRTIQLRTTPKGKPYIEGAAFGFNISHSDDIWLCIIGRGKCGIDVQKPTRADFRKLIKRFFGEREQAYVEEHGKEGFYRIWARREAYAKYTGEGFFGEMPSFVDEDGRLAVEVTVPSAAAAKQPERAYIRELNVGHGAFCAYCTGERECQIEFYR